MTDTNKYYLVLDIDPFCDSRLRAVADVVESCWAARRDVCDAPKVAKVLEVLGYDVRVGTDDSEWARMVRESEGCECETGN